MRVIIQLITNGENPGDILKEWTWEDSVPDMDSVDLIHYNNSPYVYFDSADDGDTEILIYCMAEKVLSIKEDGSHLMIVSEAGSLSPDHWNVCGVDYDKKGLVK